MVDDARAFCWLIVPVRGDAQREIVGYMMELARPQRIRLQTAIDPVVPTATNISATPKKPEPASNFSALTAFIAHVPAKRPIMMAKHIERGQNSQQHS